MKNVFVADTGRGKAFLKGLAGLHSTRRFRSTHRPRTLAVAKQGPCVPERLCSAPRSGLGRWSDSLQQTRFLILSLH